MEDPGTYTGFLRARQAAQYNRFSEILAGGIQAGRYAIQYLALLYYVARISIIVAGTTLVLMLPAVIWLSIAADKKYMYDKTRTRVAFRSSYWTTYLNRDSMPDIHGNQEQDFIFLKWAETFKDELTQHKKDAKLQFARLFPAETWLAFATMVGIGELIVLIGSGNVASVVASMQAVMMMVTGLSGFSYAYLSVREQFRYVDETSEWLMQASKNESHRTSTPEVGYVLVEDVGYRYPTQQKWAIQHVTATLRTGTVTALVGENGAGKSTLARCVLGQLRLSEGHVLLDGQVELEYGDGWRDCAAYLPQHVLPMEVTLREYVTMGRVQSDDDIVAALRRVRGGDLIDDLDQPLGVYLHDGKSLSGGEWQKLGMARLLLRKQAKCIVLDEPYASVDPASEEEFMKIYEELAAKAIMVVITHRLMVAERSDQVIYVNAGRAVAGTHAELIETSEAYRSHWRKTTTTTTGRDSECLVSRSL